MTRDTEYEACLRALNTGHLVAFPTDTFYALSCDPFNADAVGRLRAMKGSPAGRPLSLLLPPSFDVATIGCHLSAQAQVLIERFWPGPLTLVVPCDGSLSRLVGGAPDGAVGIREPAEPTPTTMLSEWGRPVVGTSANPVGLPPARIADEVRDYFGDDVCTIAGHAPGVAASTVVRVVEDRIELLREGMIPRSELPT